MEEGRGGEGGALLSVIPVFVLSFSVSFFTLLSPSISLRVFPSIRCVGGSVSVCLFIYLFIYLYLSIYLYMESPTFGKRKTLPKNHAYLQFFFPTSVSEMKIIKSISESTFRKMHKTLPSQIAFVNFNFDDRGKHLHI